MSDYGKMTTIYTYGIDAYHVKGIELVHLEIIEDLYFISDGDLTDRRIKEKIQN